MQCIDKDAIRVGKTLLMCHSIVASNRREKPTGNIQIPLDNWEVASEAQTLTAVRNTCKEREQEDGK